MVHIASIISSDFIYFFYKAEIVSFKVDKASTAILAEFINSVDASSLILVGELPEDTEIKNYIMELIDCK